MHWRWLKTQTMRIAEASSNRVRFGYYTSSIILMDENRLAAESNAREIAKQLQHHGFPAVIEHVNANEAYLGSLPGHGYRNVRRPLIHTRNLADLMPTTNVWPGEEINPCPFYPENSSPLCYAATTGGNRLSTEPTCWRRRPYPNLWSDWFRQIDATRPVNRAVLPLSERASFLLRQGPVSICADQSRRRRSLRSRRKRNRFLSACECKRRQRADVGAGLAGNSAQLARCDPPSATSESHLACPPATGRQRI